MDLEKIANLIKTKRKEKNMTQEELALKLHVTEKAISRWECCRGMPDISLVVPLSRELGVSASELLTGNADQKTEEGIEKVLSYMNVNEKRKNKKALFVAISFYVVILFFYLVFLKKIYSGGMLMNYIGTFLIHCLFCGALYMPNYILANYYFDKVEDRKRMKKITMFLWLVLYVILIFNFTIFGRVVGENRYNLVPFRTIIDYVGPFRHYNLNVIVINLLGNILVFMPISYFLLQLSEIRKFWPFFLISLSISFGIELLQFVTHTGVFDVDDIFLNLLGMILVYVGKFCYEKTLKKIKKIK